MIDEPNKELDMPVMEDEDFESFYSKICEEFGGEPQSEEDYLKELMTGEEQPSEEAPAGDAPDYADQPKNAAPVKKDHSIRNLTILVVLEVLGIIGVAGWWILRLL